jgi:hypothetical protein
MEAAYYFEEKHKADVEKLMLDEFFKRLGPISRDAKLLGTKRDSGVYLYVKAESPEKFQQAELRISESKIPFVRLAGDEAKAVVDAIHREEEEAASGMGAIFG